MTVASPAKAFQTKEQEVAGIEEALNTLLETALALDAARRQRANSLPGPTKYEFITIGDLMKKTEAQMVSEDLVKNPVGQACRMAVRSLGKRLYELGGLEAMSATLDRVAERDPATWGSRTDIMDKRWDGIGREGDGAGWCA